MKIEPRSEKEFNSYSLIPDGDWPFTVLQSRERASNSVKNKGKMMFEVKLNVHGPDGDRHIFDYFADWLSPWKLRHFCETTGQIKEYESGVVDGDGNAFAGRTGYVTLKTKEAEGNFSAKNEVADYVVKKTAEQPATTSPADDSDVPF